MLYCVTCRTMADAGSALCAVCKNGFVSSLACATCQKIVPRGQAYCANCAPTGLPSSPHVDSFAADRNSRSVARRQSPSPVLDLALPALPGLSLERAQVRESYTAGQFGAVSDVQMSGRDAEILTKVNQVVVLLHALAQEMNNLQALSDITRRNIKACRNLASDLQEEVEVRVGPGGGR